MNKKYLFILKIFIWVVFFVVSGLIYYVNHYLPHGSKYLTDEIVCQNDDRGSCGLEYKEDLQGVSIPEWAEFFRGDSWFVLWIGIAVIGILINQSTNRRE
jgi:hypothetical protein